MIRIIQATRMKPRHTRRKKGKWKTLSMFYEGINLYNDGWKKEKKRYHWKKSWRCNCVCSNTHFHTYSRTRLQKHKNLRISNTPAVLEGKFNTDAHKNIIQVSGKQRNVNPQHRHNLVIHTLNMLDKYILCIKNVDFSSLFLPLTSFVLFFLLPREKGGLYGIFWKASRSYDFYPLS